MARRAESIHWSRGVAASGATYDSLIEFRSEKLEKIRDAVAREHGFRVTGHRLIVQGVCADCLAKQSRPTRPLDLV